MAEIIHRTRFGIQVRVTFAVIVTDVQGRRGEGGEGGGIERRTGRRG